MPALIERPKMSLNMWSALKTHIMKQREKKKQEQEADAAVQQIRREQEMKRKQDAMTLEEIKDQLCRLERKLNKLKEDKHQLFLQLKKVLHEDETRRRAMVKEPNDVIQVSHPYPPHGMAVGGPHAMYMMGGGPLMGRGSVMYKVGAPSHHTLLPPGTMKRPRSPSPPPQSGGYQAYNYKTHVTTYGQSSSATAVVVTSAPYSGYPGPHPSSQYPGPPEQGLSAKHIPGGYLSHLPQGYVGPLHQLEHANQKAGFVEEKFYIQQPSVVPLRGVAALPTVQPVIPVQQQTKPGGITSGYPVRAQPPPPSSATHFQPPTSSAPPSAQTGYQQGSARHSYQGQSTPRFY